MSEAAAAPVAETPVSAPAPAETPAAAPPAGAAPEADAPAAAPTGAAATIGGGNVEEKPVAVTATWPEDWRVKLAGEDKGYLKTLERFTDPTALAKAYRELQTKVSSGQVKTALKADASPEEAATWRRENGIPEKADDYKVELPDGIVFGEADKPVIDAFKTTAFEANMTPDQVNKALGWYGKYQEEIQTRQFEADTAFKAKVEDELRAEWGPAYRTEIKGIDNFLSAAPDGLAQQLLAARTPDGSLVGNDPRFLKWMASLVREVNPMASLVPAGTSDPGKLGAARIAEIETKMRTDPQGYWKNPGLQEEYGQLLEAREKLKSRAG